MFICVCWVCTYKTESLPGHIYPIPIGTVPEATTKEILGN